MFLGTMGAWLLWKTEQGFRSSETGVTDTCELPCGCRESNPLEEHPVVLATESCLQPLVFFKIIFAGRYSDDSSLPALLHSV